MLYEERATIAHAYLYVEPKGCVNPTGNHVVIVPPGSQYPVHLLTRGYNCYPCCTIETELCTLWGLEANMQLHSLAEIFGGLANESRYWRDDPSSEEPPITVVRSIINVPFTENVSLNISDEMLQKRSLKPWDLLVTAKFAGDRVQTSIVADIVDCTQPVIAGQLFIVVRLHEESQQGTRILQGFLQSSIGQQRLREAATQVQFSNPRSQPLHQMAISKLKTMFVPGPVCWDEMATYLEQIQSLQTQLNTAIAEFNAYCDRL